MCDHKDDNFTLITAKCHLNAKRKLGNVDFSNFQTVKILISHNHATAWNVISLGEKCKVHFTQHLSSKTSIPGQNRSEF